jgi:hypothetical protein
MKVLIIVLSTLLVVAQAENFTYKLKVLTGPGEYSVKGKLIVVLQADAGSKEVTVYDGEVKYLHVYDTITKDVRFKIEDVKTVNFKWVSDDGDSAVTLSQLRIIPSYIDDDDERNDKYQYRCPKDSKVPIKSGQEIPTDIC